MPGGHLEWTPKCDSHKKKTTLFETGDLRPVVLQEVLADQMQMPLPTADRKFKFIEGLVCSDARELQHIDA